MEAENYYEKVKKEHPDFKLIRGNEIYLTRNGLNASNFKKGVDRFYHFILLAKDLEGYKQLRILSTRAWKRSFRGRGKILRRPTYYSDLIEVIGENKGHLIAQNACLGSLVDTQLLLYNQTKDPTLYAKIQKWVLQMNELFGAGNFYLEMQPSNTQEQIIANKGLLKLSQELGIPYVITLDEHYLKKSDRKIHKAYLTSQPGEREVDSFYATTYMMGTEELESFFPYLQKSEIYAAYDSIERIAGMCEDYTIKKPLKIPSLKWKIPQTSIIASEWFERIPQLKTFCESDFEGDKILARAVIDGIESHEDLKNERAWNEINSNLEMTWISSNANKAHWSAYFLNLQNIIEECWNAGTLIGVARGSGGSFLLLYVLGITQMNPLREKTRMFAWRFLNPNRVSVLD